MKIRSASVAVIFGISIAACSGSSTGDGMGGADGEVEKKVVTREEVPDGRFKPGALEESIDAMIAGIESTVAADEELSLGVVLKEVQGFWRPVQVGASRALGELEVVGSVKGSTETGLPVEESVPEQIGFVEEQFELDVDGLAIAPHNDDLLPYMEDFTDAEK